MAPRKSWEKTSMQGAVTAVRNKEMGYKRASKIFEVPRATLKDYVKSGLPIENVGAKKIGRPTILPTEIEDKLVEYCQQMERHYYGLTSDDVRHMAFQLALQNNLPHPFKGGAAGKKWLRLFLKRHPALSMRRPENLSMARVKGFTKANVDTFFKVLEPQLEKVNYDPVKVFNVDETGISVVQHKARKIIATKGKKEVQKLSSAERGATVTVVTCMSAAGQYVPPLLIFPQKRWQNELLDGAPPGSIGGCSDSGWITGPLFSKWLEHFINITKPSIGSPVVLVLDGHYSHTRNIDVIERAREMGVLIVCLPPHSTSKMQPLDVSFMGPLKNYYSQAIENWLAHNPGRVVKKLQIAQLLGIAYMKAATMQTAVNGFSKTGILPCNRDCFPESVFITTEATNDTNDEDSPMAVLSPEHTNPVPTIASLEHTSPVSSIIVVSPENIRPIPTMEITESARPRSSAFIVTSTPHMEKVKAAEKRKEDMEKKKILKGKTLFQKKRPVKREKVDTNKIIKKENEGGNKTIKANRRQKKANRNQQSKRQDPFSSDESDGVLSDYSLVSTDDEDSEDDSECKICGKLYSTDKEGQKWAKCSKCFNWYHEKCCSLPNKRPLICDICLN